jgi:hypothetical protein
MGWLTKMATAKGIRIPQTAFKSIPSHATEIRHLWIEFLCTFLTFQLQVPSALPDWIASHKYCKHTEASRCESACDDWDFHADWSDNRIWSQKYHVSKFWAIHYIRQVRIQNKLTWDIGKAFHPCGLPYAASTDFGLWIVYHKLYI